MKHSSFHAVFVAIVVALLWLATMTYVAIGQYLHLTGGIETSSNWPIAVRAVLYLLVLCSIMLASVLYRHVRNMRSTTSKNMLVGKQIAVFMIVAVILSVQCFLAFVLFLSGGPIIDLQICGGLALIGIFFWTFINREVFVLKNSEAGKSLWNKLQMRHFNLVLVICGILMVTFLAINIVSLWFLQST
ncbi:hypothetical protein [Desulfatitalea alkaliphila]|uniref:Uncharacterized protein n=1 Tax=Desulfatitalea alkaliphila TaxID=2929485 RepID=A0AA41R5J9_9BACT|nr:hypothetical protein [Desulfatitalea alkaliphila]MCJ8503179.1 hypothetical protein [Desulfatitalea alkaliphila]